MEMDHPDEAFDLLVIPQLDHQAPGPHLSPEDFKHAQKDWARFGTPPPDHVAGTWKVAVAHIVDGDMTATAVINIPRHIEGAVPTPTHGNAATPAS